LGPGENSIDDSCGSADEIWTQARLLLLDSAANRRCNQGIQRRMATHPTACLLSLFLYIKYIKKREKGGSNFDGPLLSFNFPFVRGEAKRVTEREREKKMHKLLSDRSSEKRGRVLLDAGKEEG